MEAYRKMLDKAPSINDEDGFCTSCGRDNNGHEGEPCSDDCPSYECTTCAAATETRAFPCDECGHADEEDEA